MVEHWQICATFDLPSSSAWVTLDRWLQDHARSLVRWQDGGPEGGVATYLDLRADDPTALASLATTDASETLAGRFLFFEASVENSSSFDSLTKTLAEESPDWVASRSEPRSEHWLLTRRGHLEVPGAGRWFLFRCHQRAASFQKALSRGVPRAPEGPLGGRGDWFRKRHGGGDLS